MHSRERGIAHVNIFFFLIMLVLFLGALGFGYVQLSEKVDMRAAMNEAIADANELANEKLIRDRYIQQISDLLGETGQFDDAGFKYEDPVPAPLENVTVPDRVQATLRTFGNEASVPESLNRGLSTYLGQVKVKIDGLRKRITDLEAMNAKLTADKSAAQSAVAAANASKSQEVNKLNRQQSELRQYVDSEFRKNQNRIRTLQGEIAKRVQELNDLREENARVVLGLKKDNNLLKARIDAATNLTELINPPQAPDGSVISASQVAGRAWIDLGRQDMLQRGITFRITSPDREGIKAYGTVTELEADRAEILISGLRDRLDPVVKGDLVSNDLYSPHIRRNIYLLGRFSHPLTKPVIETILENLGNRVADDIGPGVDLVIVGDDVLNEQNDGFTPIEETEEYKKALQLGIEIAPLNKVRDFLELSGD